MSEFQINGIQFPNPVVKNKLDEIKPADSGPSFGETLETAIKEVSNLQTEAGSQAQKLMTGNSHDIHTTMVALQKAEISFQMMMQVRNKIVSAYQEIMKMQV